MAKRHAGEVKGAVAALPRPAGRQKAGESGVETKTFSCEFKVTDPEQGIVEAIVSVFGNEDYGGDIVVRGAFADSLKAKLPKVCWMHDWEQPIGKTLAAEEVPAGDPRLPAKIAQNGGLWVRGQFNLEKQIARDVLSDLKGGFIDEFSFGYMTEDCNWKEDGQTRELTKLQIFEWSPVLLGMNPATALLSAKQRREPGQKDGYQPEPYRQDTDELVVCPQCQKHNDDDANYCDQCGFDLTSTGFKPAPYRQDPDETVGCPQCKRANDTDAQYCDQCGFELAGADGVFDATPAGKAAHAARQKGAIPVHHTATDDGAWDGGKNVAALPSPMSVATAKAEFAWLDDSQIEDGEIVKSAGKFPHHLVNDGKPGAAVKIACSAGIAALNGGRGGATIPEGDKKGVWEHLATHLNDAGVEEDDIPPLKSAQPVGLKLAEHAQKVLDTGAEARDAGKTFAGSVSEFVQRVKSVHQLRAKDGRVLSAATLMVLGDLSGDLDDAISILSDCRDDLNEFMQAVASGGDGSAGGGDEGADDEGKTTLALRTLEARTTLAGELLASTNTSKEKNAR